MNIRRHRAKTYAKLHKRINAKRLHIVMPYFDMYFPDLLRGPSGYAQHQRDDEFIDTYLKKLSEIKKPVFGCIRRIAMRRKQKSSDTEISVETT